MDMQHADAILQLEEDIDVAISQAAEVLSDKEIAAELRRMANALIEGDD